MKYCVHGLGYMTECGADAVTKREGWPLCAEHARVWDGFTAMAEQSEPDEDVDFVEYARDVRAGRR